MGYPYNSNGNGVSAINNIQYRPFGRALSWAWSNGTSYSFNTDANLTSYPLGSIDTRSLLSWGWGRFA